MKSSLETVMILMNNYVDDSRVSSIEVPPVTRRQRKYSCLLDSLFWSNIEIRLENGSSDHNF